MSCFSPIQIVRVRRQVVVGITIIIGGMTRP